LKKWYFLYKFHVEKVVVTSHHRHIQSCAYAVKLEHTYYMYSIHIRT